MFNINNSVLYILCLYIILMAENLSYDESINSNAKFYETMNF